MYLKVHLPIFILLFQAVKSLYVPPREEMIQRQACSFTPYSKQLTCRCIDHETNSALKLELSFFIIDKGQEVSLACQYIFKKPSTVCLAVKCVITCKLCVTLFRIKGQWQFSFSTFAFAKQIGLNC